jgi:hypothetical protein
MKSREGRMEEKQEKRIARHKKKLSNQSSKTVSWIVKKIANKKISLEK